ncbi:hypothetical protein [Kitasatospora sp. NPDC002040]|uniref:hypothetical protein n=1 Tax=Kitasatospora sp. NPDC002040 TaxID=3154661 RepID=UPI00331A8878
MTSFTTHRDRVLDPGLSTMQRHRALWVCLDVFAPYGFLRTYHHLTVSALMPRQLEDDPGSLVRAVTELDRARTIRQQAAARYAERRRQEKRAGLRRPDRPGPWWWPSRPRSYVVDEYCHPALALPEFVGREVRLAEGEQPTGCRSCGDGRPPVLRSTGHGFVELCPGCGWVRQDCGCGRSHVFVHPERVSWASLRLREHLNGDGRPFERHAVAERIAGLVEVRRSSRSL